MIAVYSVAERAQKCETLLDVLEIAVAESQRFFISSKLTYSENLKLHFPDFIRLCLVLRRPPAEHGHTVHQAGFIVRQCADGINSKNSH